MPSRSKISVADDTTETGPPATAPAHPATVPVIAIGASSGGLKALEAFFRKMPADSGMAFVLAMHLSTEHESQLDRILRNFTAMPVMQVNRDVNIFRDHVYVISPRQHLSIKGSRLNITPRGRPPASGVIDHLFQSLANDRQERAVGIVFSGSGADGTLGLQAIKERGGILLAQDPEEAEYASMPRNIIATGLVDFVLPVGEMPARLMELKDREPWVARPGLREGETEAVGDLIPGILQRLQSHMGYDFSHYKRSTLLRQLDRRMLVLHIDGLSAYAQRLQEDDEEIEALFRNLLIGVTRFFRDSDAYLSLEREVLPALFQDTGAAGNGEAGAVRAWVAGCATGEEAYSLAMLLAEYREVAGLEVPLQVLASDIDEEALASARRGLYPEAVAAAVGPARLNRFFDRKDGAWQVGDELRSMVVFATHDLTRDPPFARIDLVSCRNLLMYFEPGMQQQILERCAYSLRPGGYLFLGTAESPGRAAALFTDVSRKHGLFQRSLSARSFAPANFLPLTGGFSALQGPKSHHGLRARTISPEDPGGQKSEQGPAGMTAPAGTGVYEPSSDALILANQEMQSLNEELRSMMEELEVAKEEMQSLNEELITVNQELQNKIEELRRVNGDLHILIESTHMATLFLDQQLNVLLYTPESKAIFNLLPVDIGRPLEHLSHRLTYENVLQDAQNVLENGCEVVNEVQDQSEKWYSMRVMPYPTANGPAEGVVLTFADITFQKREEQVSQDRFSLAFHAGPMAACIVTRDESQFVDVNHIFEDITGYSRDDVVGLNARSFDLFFGDKPEAVPTDRRGIPAPGEMETRMWTRAGTQHDLVVSTTAIEFEGRPCYLSLFYDVTERKRLEREILLVSDREQRRIGVDLHDGLGTHLTGVAMMARGLARNLRSGRSVSAEEMDEIARLLGNGVEQARALAQGLNPYLLEARGLTTALGDLAANLETQTGISCSFEEKGTGQDLSSDQSIHLYRIAQEALSNAVRHAEASTIRIIFSRKGSHFKLMIRDNGKGFQESLKEASGMGLSIMRYRAELIGARLEVSAVAGGGTTVTCSLGTAA